MVVRPYSEADAPAWDDLVVRSWNGTFLLTRAYLARTGPAADDRSVVLEDRSSVVAVFPAAVHASDATMVESHPAVGYGGLVHAGALRGGRMLEALEAVAERYFHDGLGSLRYKPVPYPYHRVPSADDLYALHRLGAVRSRCDVASVVDLAHRPSPSKRRVRSLRKAERAGVRVEHGHGRLEDVWRVVAGRLAERYAAEPLHTLDGLRGVARAFPEAVDCAAGLVEEQVVAGVVVFRTGPADHAQYIGADERGHELSALDAVLESCLADAGRRQARYFSFGNSTLYGGRVFNEGLFRYKSEFGAGTVVHEAYDLALV